MFSAGLDIMSVYGRTSDEIYSFAMDIQNAWIALYGNPMITVAGINVSWKQINIACAI